MIALMSCLHTAHITSIQRDYIAVFNNEQAMTSAFMRLRYQGCFVENSKEHKGLCCINPS